METTFYEDGMANNRSAVKDLKKAMTLDFGAGKTKAQKFGGLLNSPDLNLLKLGSPELERMIIQQNGMVVTTPTPTQFIYPKNVTEEQEAYARGFVDALAELHQHPEESSSSGTVPSSASHTLTTLQPMRTTAPSATTCTSLPGTTVMVSAPASYAPPMQQSHPNYAMPQNMQLTHLKEEPQTVPCLGTTPPLSPINMESQERIKLERKRARNRVAARKCRTRKLERISRLEERVNHLKSINTELSSTAGQLRDQVAYLKQQIMEHVNSGCQVMISTSMS
ncbi:transcription factor AP-1 [Lingula anatina]|uniref:Transcription factor AP-1 n=1 Tax=Lingula anatina TaxID=7574 RepID=A0A1S3IKG6_LINAN|nr:transcription factor AP-1 [Lingula anatina]|eukprot:XP_013398583.1 transcription factor AP-1 [Lingula anatina]